MTANRSDIPNQDKNFCPSSYFSAGSLAHSFAACGFEVSNCAEAFAGQFLGIEAFCRAGFQPAFSHANNLASMANDVATFAERYSSQVSAWRSS